MIVTRLEASHVAVDFVEPYHLSRHYGTQFEAHAVIVELHTDEGLVGLGEADPLLPFTNETIDSVIAALQRQIAPILIGANPKAIGEILSLIEAATPEMPTARGAIDMALHDLMGKAMGLPVRALLGRMHNPKIPLLFGVSSGTPAENIATIEAEMERGHRCFMLKMGAGDVNEDVERAMAVRRRFGSSISLLADANQGWTTEEATQFLRQTTDSALDLVEQPLHRDEVAATARLRQEFGVPISADEGVASPDDAAKLIRAGAADVFSIKVSKHGGIRPSWLIAQMADSFGVECLMNSMLEFGVSQAASLQLGATLPNLVSVGHAYGSVLRLSDDVTDFAANIHDGVVTVPDRPGLGVGLDRAKLNRYLRGRVVIE